MTIEQIKHLSVEFFPGNYSVRSSNCKIYSGINFNSEKWLVTFYYNSGNNYYEKTYPAKSEKKAITLLKKAEKDFKKADKKNSCKHMGMIKEYSSYIDYLNQDFDFRLADIFN